MTPVAVHKSCGSLSFAVKFGNEGFSVTGSVLFEILTVAQAAFSAAMTTSECSQGIPREPYSHGTS